MLILLSVPTDEGFVVDGKLLFGMDVDMSIIEILIQVKKTLSFL